MKVPLVLLAVFVGIALSQRSTRTTTESSEETSNPTTTQDPRPTGGPDDVECIDPEGLYPHKEYCWLYWNCGNGIAYGEVCDENFHYSIEHKWCDYPDNVDCGDRLPRPENTELPPTTTPAPDVECLDPEGLYPNKEFCWKYWNCGGGVPYPAECPQDWHYDIPHQYCDHPNRVDCGDRLPRPEEIVAHDAPTTTPPTPTPADWYDCEEGEDGFHVNPWDCHSFIHCSNGDAWLNECPDGLEFDEETLQCDYDENVDCTPTMTSPSPGFKCVSDGYFPNPQDCTSAWKCVKGIPYLEKCPKGLHWNLKSAKCDSPQNANCGDPLKRGPTTAAPPIDWYECDPNVDGLFLNPFDCHSFIQCSNGFAYLHTCPSDLVFNPETDLCDYDYNVNCNVNEHAQDDSANTDETSDAPITTTTEIPILDWFDCPGNGLFPYPYDCTAYIRCVVNVAYLLYCAPPFEFSAELSSCVDPSISNCTAVTGATPTVATGTPPVPTPDPDFECPSESGLFPYLQDCRFYYQCTNSNPILKQCAGSLWFDPQLKYCNFPSQIEEYECTPPGREDTDVETLLEAKPKRQSSSGPLLEVGRERHRHLDRPVAGDERKHRPLIFHPPQGKMHVVKRHRDVSTNNENNRHHLGESQRQVGESQRQLGDENKKERKPGSERKTPLITKKVLQEMTAYVENNHGIFKPSENLRRMIEIFKKRHQ